MKYKQHIPNCVNDGQGGVSGEYSSLEELLEIPFIKRQTTNKEFVRFSFSEKRDNSGLLMLELKNSFWVIAYLSENPGLPIWKKI